ncbi:MAG TPA: hypothetical protein DD649_13945 [Providencia sp.]|nr:glycoside hydrolase family protein [Providencia sp.]HBO23971.1 hypothetical protein [Providencia sp.]
MNSNHGTLRRELLLRRRSVFSRSTLLKKLNSDDIHGACNELRRWTYAVGKQWKGLVTKMK